MNRKDETQEEMIPRGFEQKGAPGPPERVLANFEALPDEDRLWMYEMISGWMWQGGDGEGEPSREVRVAAGDLAATGRLTRTEEKGMSRTAFGFLRKNEREGKPRSRGITEIRGPYYSAMGKRYLEDILETMGEHVDSLKFAGGSFALMPEGALREIIDLAHRHDVLVSTGGFIEYVLTQGPEAVQKYIDECRNVGFDIVEISGGFVTVPTDDWLRLVEKVQEAGLKAKPEVGIQFGAGGDTPSEELKAEGTRDPEWMVSQAGRLLDAGAYMVMIESEGITENVDPWRTDVPAEVINALGLEKVMFEAADPAVFEWYVKNYGPEVNLFVDHSQIVQLETLRRGIWGTKSTWGRVLTYKG